VTDHGYGISNDFKQYIFKQYALAISTDKSIVRSSGIGLNIAQTIIEMHGGTIGFNTKVGEGTTFYFTLPVSE
jgi:signal transduction histidine kinase